MRQEAKNEKSKKKAKEAKRQRTQTCESIMGPPWDSNKFSAFINPTIFSVNPCIALCNSI